MDGNSMRMSYITVQTNTRNLENVFENGSVTLCTLALDLFCISLPALFTPPPPPSRSNIVAQRWMGRRITHPPADSARDGHSAAP